MLILCLFGHQSYQHGSYRPSHQLQRQHMAYNFRGVQSLHAAHPYSNRSPLAGTRFRGHVDEIKRRAVQNFKNKPERIRGSRVISVKKNLGRGKWDVEVKKVGQWSGQHRIRIRTWWWKERRTRSDVTGDWSTLTRTACPPQPAASVVPPGIARNLRSALLY